MEMSSKDNNKQTIRLKNGHVIFIEQINENQYTYRTGLLEPRVRDMARNYEDNDLTRKYPPEKLHDAFPSLSPVSKPIVYSKEEIQEIISLAQKVDENGKLPEKEHQAEQQYSSDERINEIFNRVRNALKKSSKSTNTTDLDKLVSVNQEKITAMLNKYARER